MELVRAIEGERSPRATAFQKRAGSYALVLLDVRTFSWEVMLIKRAWCEPGAVHISQWNRPDQNAQEEAHRDSTLV